MSRLATWLGIGAPKQAGCGDCVHFCTDPDVLESELPGLAILSSAHASVRGGDGLCLMHDRLINGRRRCASFAEPQELGAFRAS